VSGNRYSQPFESMSKNFGTSSSSGTNFYAFLEHLFQPIGATYIADFLIHILPLPSKRKALVRARWARFENELMAKYAALLHHRDAATKSSVGQLPSLPNFDVCKITPSQGSPIKDNRLDGQSFIEFQPEDASM